MNAWLRSIRREIKVLIDSNAFKKGNHTPSDDDEVLPTTVRYKVKINSEGKVDKLKCRIAVRGDLQQSINDTDLWSGVVNTKTVKIFLCRAAKLKKQVIQIDFVGAFLQARVKQRLFVTLPAEFESYFPEFKDYFGKPQLLDKAMYGTSIASKCWNEDLTEYFTKSAGFSQSSVDSSLFIKRLPDGKYIELILYVDDAMMFFDSDQTKEEFFKDLKTRFVFNILGHAHWFLQMRIHRYDDGSYSLDQMRYTLFLLDKNCPTNSPWGRPLHRDSPAPPKYAFTKDNQPKNDEEHKAIKDKYPGLQMSSAVCSLLYLAMGTRCDILWIVNKLAKSCKHPGMEDFHALMWCFGYLRKYIDRGIKFYNNHEESSVHMICDKMNLKSDGLIGFSDSSWHDCSDTGRSTTGYKIFYRGTIVDSNSSMPTPISMSTAEAEYMAAALCCMTLAHFRSLQYDFENLGTKEYDVNKEFKDTPVMLLVDNSATVDMSKNYKQTKKNRHIARRFHYVRQGTQMNIHK